jgi:hypothetical protein
MIICLVLPFMKLSIFLFVLICLIIFLSVAGIKCLNVSLYLLRLNKCQLYFYIFLAMSDEGTVPLSGELQV